MLSYAKLLKIMKSGAYHFADRALGLLTSSLQTTASYSAGPMQPNVGKFSKILDWYEVASGQQVNKAKTTLFFSRNTPESVQQEIKVLLGVLAIKHYEKYLGTILCWEAKKSLL